MIGGVERATAVLVEHVTRAAQATVPLGQVVVVSNDIKEYGGMRTGYLLVMAVDETRPFTVDELAASAAAALGHLGWAAVTKSEGEYRDVRANHADFPGYGISVLCNANNPVTQWNAHTPAFPE